MTVVQCLRLCRSEVGEVLVGRSLFNQSTQFRVPADLDVVDITPRAPADGSAFASVVKVCGGRREPSGV